MKFVEIKKIHIFLSVFIFTIILALIINPKTYMDSTLNGLTVWLTCVVPSLFPFFFFTKLLTKLKLVSKISKAFCPITQKLFNVPGISSYIFFMSVISGYPVGAKLISESFKSGQITNAQATRMNAFCSTSGPFFIIGTVGVGMFYSKTAGIIILISHLLGAILNGLLYRNYKKEEKVLLSNLNLAPKQDEDDILKVTMYDSIISILIVGGYITIFFIIIDFLFNFQILSTLSYVLQTVFSFTNLPPNFFDSILSGIVEVTRGCLDLSQSGVNLKLLCVFSTFLISFGGFSIHLQSLSFLQSAKIKMSVYFLQKLTHSIISCFIAYILCLIFL